MNLIECMIDDLREKEKVDQMIPENLIDLMEVFCSIFLFKFTLTST